MGLYMKKKLPKKDKEDKRDTIGYSRRKNGKKVYFGITNDPYRRFNEEEGGS